MFQEQLGNYIDSQRHQFLITHIFTPFLPIIAMSYVLMAGGGDQWLADSIYGMQGHEWRFVDNWLASTILHRGGKIASILAAITVFCLYTISFLKCAPYIRLWRTPLCYLLLTIIASVVAISLLKSLTNMDCPWSLVDYGGDRPFVGLFETRPSGLGRGKCFPAGHASAGYAWISLYFFYLMVKPSYRWLGLAIGILSGLIFGLTQQFRGAHFASHDLWSLAICWYISALMYTFFSKFESHPRRHYCEKQLYQA